ncbi:uncharacterized protein LOC108092268 [Drosophila ficusphila]|uniref:uncharacterized protein LOC108092268 n=1 Tax=Drosophila ficusphila TaxID=30025 RepID=UPI001C8B025D|nr:uncharacterized protein LOC108092268 [Drosophila ficusphila]
MAWVPKSRFEHDFVDMEPGFNLIHGQLAYEEKRKSEFRTMPKNTHEYLMARDELQGSTVGKGREIRESLQMMEKIQKIAGTNPLGELATMEDWEDTKTVEREAVAMMRYFGTISMREESLPEISIPLINQEGSQRVIADPQIFTPRKTRKSKSPPDNSANSSDDSFHTAEGPSSCILLYGSGSKPNKSNKKVIRGKGTSFTDLMVIPVNMRQVKGKRKISRPSQKDRLRLQFE